MPLLLTLDPAKRHDVIFTYDPEKQAWQIRFEERQPDEEDAGDGTSSGTAGQPARKHQGRDAEVRGQGGGGR